MVFEFDSRMDMEDLLLLLKVSLSNQTHHEDAFHGRVQKTKSHIKINDNEY